MCDLRRLDTDLRVGDREGVLPEKLCVVCVPLPQTLTLFITKICDVPYSIYDRTKHSILYL